MDEVKEIAMAEYRGEWCVGVVYSDNVYDVIHTGKKFASRDEATDYAHTLAKKFHLGIFVYPEDS